MVLTTAYGYLTRIYVPVAGTCTYLDTVFTTGNTVTNAIWGLYTGSGVNPVAYTAESHLVVTGTAGLYSIAWTTPVALTPGYYYVYQEVEGTTPSMPGVTATSTGLDRRDGHEPELRPGQRHPELGAARLGCDGDDRRDDEADVGHLVGVRGDQALVRAAVSRCRTSPTPPAACPCSAARTWTTTGTSRTAPCRSTRASRRASSSPAMSPPTRRPSSRRTIRTVTCVMPQWADVLNTDRLQGPDGTVWAVIEVTAIPTLGYPADKVLKLRRVTGAGV